MTTPTADAKAVVGMEAPETDQDTQDEAADYVDRHCAPGIASEVAAPARTYRANDPMAPPTATHIAVVIAERG